MNDATAMAQMMQDVDEKGKSGPKSLLPVKYESATTTTLKEKVGAEGLHGLVLQLVD